MILRKSFVFFAFVLCQYICAQIIPTINLDEVLISDSKLNKFSNSQSIQKLKDSVIVNNRASLTSLLQFNSVIYFKENGLGMVSSPSFRGTTASQTAVIWNGININSQLNGQTDFNTISGRDFNSVAIRAGGGGAIYGSSAIGGSVHLITDLKFVNQFKNRILLDYGSFNTLGVNYQLQMASKKTSFQASISRNSSDNDYTYLGTNLKNENGQFYNTSLNLSLAYKFQENNQLKFYSYLFESERHLSGTIVTISNNKYNDLNSRNLLEWQLNKNKLTSTARLAFLSEKYKYFENAIATTYSFGESKTLISKYDLGFKLTDKIELNTIVEYNNARATGSNIGADNRQIGSGILLFKHKPTSKFLYELSARKEISNQYSSPILFSLGTNFSPFSFYDLKFNVSRNYRIPTFNDLYWQGSGNPNLNPESSIQGEIGHVFKFKKTTFSVTNFYNKIKDLIQWSPGVDGNWRPNNVGKVATYGLEILANHSTKINRNTIDFVATYAYTISENELKKKQLIYVPFHKITGSLAYSIKNFSSHFQFLYNGEVFTSSDNFYTLDDYLVSNIGFDYQLNKKKNLIICFDVLNAFNESYQNIEVRPMPGRNYTINLTFNY